ncbi:MAG: thioredoxin family protein, partial [Verrucomicrobiaceae bacterium]
MKRSPLWTLALAATVTLTSCGLVGKGDKKEKEEPNPFGATGIPPELRRKSGGADADAGTPVTAGGNQAGQKDKPMLQFTPDEDIVFTDPDAPDADIPELSNLLAAPKRGPWESSETIARQRSLREGKPMLIWFTDSQRSPMCKAVSQELFSTHEFGSWATEKLVRLKIDAVPDDNMLEKTASLDDKKTLELRMLAYTADLKKRYKIMGYPSLIMLNTSGEVVGRYRGYKRGEAQYLWGQLKHAEAVSHEAYKSWRKNLEKKNYREWQDRKGRTVFAKLTSYSK